MSNNLSNISNNRINEGEFPPVIKSKSNQEFNKPLGEVKNFNLDEIKRETEFRRMKEDEKETTIKKLRDDIEEEDRKQREIDRRDSVKRTSSQWSFCIFCKSEQEETIDISDKPDFSKKRKKNNKDK